MNAESNRLREAQGQGVPWRRWGPYLSERQWGTVREDYSESGNAWDYFSHDQARSRAYRWGEDGLAGISDDKQRLCFAPAFWNGKDPILKERLFGLTNAEGNHGEDVKEYYVYYGNDFTVECPTGSGRHMNLYQVAEELSRRLTGIFLQDANGRRPVYGGADKFQTDPHWNNLILSFTNTSTGTTAPALGASHQTGWTGIVARAMHLFATSTPEQAVQLGKAAAAVEISVPRTAEVVDVPVAR